MNYGYLRVSTQEQNLENQQDAISEKFKIDKWVYEKKSGTVDYHKRLLGQLIQQLQEGDVLVMTEISRLGRSFKMVFEIVSKIAERGVRIIAIKNNFDLNPLDKSNITATVMLFAFGLSAQIERDLISERTKLGLAVARKNGKKIGRQKGEIVYGVKLRPYQKEIMRRFKEGESVNSLAKFYNVRWNTMKRFIVYFSKMKKPKKILR